MLKALAPWAPWIVLLIISLGTPLGLGVGLVAAFVTVVVLAALKLYRGILMWVTLIFFAGAFIAIFLLHNPWTLRYFAVIANAMLAVAAWAGLLVGKPFTLGQAREQVDPSMWNHPLFLRVNQMIAAAWAAAFTVNAVVAWAPTRQLLPIWSVIALTLAALLGAVIFSSWYPAHIRRIAVANDVGDGPD